MALQPLATLHLSFLAAGPATALLTRITPLVPVILGLLRLRRTAIFLKVF